MKVPTSIRSIYNDRVVRYRRLKIEIDKLVQRFKWSTWHYESRVKKIESFALKIETGRFDDPANLEDFFACTLVVANARERKSAEELVSNVFDVVRRRPPLDQVTHKRSDSFPFDDLRLYVRLKPEPSLPARDIDNLIFEFQIKTFLQHAWSIATHDLIYKSDEQDWGKERIAYQIKAMLEHAELSIYEVDLLSASDALEIEDPYTSKVRKCIQTIKDHWSDEELPDDIRRLAQNTVNLLMEINLSTKKLDGILRSETERLNGFLPMNVSPFITIVQALLHHKKASMVELLSGMNGKRYKLFVPPETDFPKDIDKEECVNAIFL